jgi:large subunit ribosomal protein L6
MSTENITQTVPCPEGVQAQVSESVLSVTGTKGTVTRNFLHPRVVIGVENNEVQFVAKKYTQNEKKIMNTFKAHVNNMFKGVTEGHEYQLKICSGHFPMNVSLKGKTFEVKNFIGEAVPRHLTIKDGAEVKINGDIIVVTGIDKELVAQTAASIETLTRRNGFDRRIFQDGIYIINKDGKAIS